MPEALVTPPAPTGQSASNNPLPAQQQQSQSTLPAVAEVVDGLSKLATSWIERFSGKNNHNPHLQVAKMIQPLINELKKEGAVVTQQLFAKLKELPTTPPVLDPSYVEPTAAEIAAQSAPVSTAKSVGAQNVRR